MVTRNIEDIADEYLDIYGESDLWGFIGFPLALGVGGLAGSVITALAVTVATGDRVIETGGEAVLAFVAHFAVVVGAGALALRETGTSRTILALVSMGSLLSGSWQLLSDGSQPPEQQAAPQALAQYTPEYRTSAREALSGTTTSARSALPSAPSLSGNSGAGPSAYQ